MGKRKQSAPQHVTDEKRQQLTWNMQDTFQQATGSSIDTISDLIDDSEVVNPDMPGHIFVAEEEAADDCVILEEEIDLTESSPLDGSLVTAGESSSIGLISVESSDSSLSKDHYRRVSDAESVTFKTEVTPLGNGSLEQHESVMSINEIFDLFQEDFEFYITVHHQNPFKPTDWYCTIGQFQMKILPKPLFFQDRGEDLPISTLIRFYVSHIKDRSMLYFKLSDGSSNGPNSISKQDSIALWFVETVLPYYCLAALKCKAFQVVLASYDPQQKTLDMKILASEAVLTKLKFPGEGCRMKTLNYNLQVLMSYFLGISAPQSYKEQGLTYTERHDIEGLYREVRKRQLCRADTDDVTVDVQHPALQPILRPYQCEAIKWMLQKEKTADNKPDNSLHSIYQEVLMPDGKNLFYNKHAGVLVKERPCVLSNQPGGILADEMGLGKTVEVISCILLHPRPECCLPERLSTPADGHQKIMEFNSCANAVVDLEKSNNSTIQSDVCSSLLPLSPSLSDTMPYCKIKGTLAANYLSNCANAEHCKLSEANKVDKMQIGSQNYDQSDYILEDAYQKSDDSDLSKTSRDFINGVEFETKSENGFIKRWSKRLSEYYSSSKVQDENDNVRKRRSKNSVVGTKSKNILKDDSSKSSRPTTEPSQRRTRSPSSMMSHESEKGKNKNESIYKDSDSNMGKTDELRKQECQESEKSKRGSFFKTTIDNRDYFECICGAVEESVEKQKTVVQCVNCRLRQHAECVNYDLCDPCRGQYKCPHCLVSSTPIPSCATLIISPCSICHQWVEEITKHVQKDTLKIFVYSGVNKQRFIQPQTLAQQDIVITTYECLRKEIDYVDLPHSNSDSGRKLRHPKRFMAIPSPIIAVEWWRICLDEAQMVECTTTKTAEMALRLTSVNRWCVTGTPIQKNVADLYGLILFLGLDPYWVQQWWKALIYEPFCYGVKGPMYDLMCQVLWRTAKKDIIDQIHLPDQTQSVHWLTFSPVEDHFYRRQYHECARLAMERLSKWTDKKDTRLSSLDRHSINQLLYPLLRLRQACCHPQAVRGEFLPIHRSTMTMEALLESLTRKARVESEEAHRQLVAAINGLAGLHIIKGEYVEAVERYREVLRSVEEHKEQLRTDDLQLLHSLHNLHEILSLKPEGVAPTLRDDQLQQQAKELKDKYMAKAAAKVASTHDTLMTFTKSVQEFQRELNDGTEWWIGLLEWASSCERDDLLVTKIKEDLTDSISVDKISLARSFRNVSGLEYVVDSQLMALISAHEKLITKVQELNGPPSQEIINKTVECCLRPVKEILHNCPFCMADELFNTYESRLFQFQERGVSVGGDVQDISVQVHSKRQGTWADCELETILKTILAFGKMYKADPDLIEFGNTHIKLFEALKKEFKHLRFIWLALREQISAIDEMDMAITRLRICLPEEPELDTPQLHILEESQVDHHKMKLISDHMIAQNELRKKLGQLLYLQNLAKSQSETQNGFNPELCPICQKELGREWSVLICGHCFCLDCIRIVAERYSFGGHNRSVKCAICRQYTGHGEISYVSTKQEADLEDGNIDKIAVKGSHSTKVEAVVRCLKKIQKEDPSAKSLVFSTWTDVLSVIGTALVENDVSFKALYEVGKFQKNLSAFKQNDDISVLLLPIHSGANGLNLIEATHVLLVEPILNPAHELQAIGRVHRIGQARSTFVHKFLIRGTIEQRIYTMLEQHEVTTNTNDKDEDTLTIRDLISLFRQQEVEEEEVEENREYQDISEVQDFTERGASVEENLHVDSSVAGVGSIETSDSEIVEENLHIDSSVRGGGERGTSKNSAGAEEIQVSGDASGKRNTERSPDSGQTEEVEVIYFEEVGEVEVATDAEADSLGPMYYHGVIVDSWNQRTAEAENKRDEDLITDEEININDDPENRDSEGIEAPGDLESAVETAADFKRYKREELFPWDIQGDYDTYSEDSEDDYDTYYEDSEDDYDTCNEDSEDDYETYSEDSEIDSSCSRTSSCHLAEEGDLEDGNGTEENINLKEYGVFGLKNQNEAGDQNDAQDSIEVEVVTEDMTEFQGSVTESTIIQKFTDGESVVLEDQIG
ncbi:hypothetical protein CHS0354_034193 [Potamilus streckersoni]|uniref:E3 ubiquitin-protein ligase SHPRH n=1 Tax=Potamilus streckersoni TaxID=2493646 RepID=A0AAE0RN48_9BIVA|nr:hypothetical protein CHS0354_034193 [Potamilus streckersoni]